MDRCHTLFMFLLEVSAGFNRRWAHLCLTNVIVLHAQSYRVCFEDFPWPQLWSTGVHVCVCLSMCMFKICIKWSETLCVGSSHCFGVKFLYSQAFLWLAPPPTPLKLVLVHHEWSHSSSFVLTYIPEPGLTKTASWKPAHVQRKREGQVFVWILQETEA